MLGSAHPSTTCTLPTHGTKGPTDKASSSLGVVGFCVQTIGSEHCNLHTPGLKGPTE